MQQNSNVVVDAAGHKKGSTRPPQMNIGHMLNFMFWLAVH
jgi:hypothetical protein